MTRPLSQQETIDEERLRRVKAVWRESAPASFEIASAERRIEARARARRRPWRPWVAYVALPAVALTALVIALAARHPEAAIGPTTERVQPPAPPSDPPAVADPAARDNARLAAAEAQHRSGQCRAARPEIEDLATHGATGEVRARAQTLLDEIARQPRPERAPADR